MSNVLLTDYCNRGCAYCFARSKVEMDSDGSHGHAGQITMDRLEIVVDFLKRSRIGTFTALGGEPTLHPDFQEIMDYVYAQGLQVRIFTNGLIDQDKLEYLARADHRRTRLIVNVNHPSEYSKAQWEATLRTLETISDVSSLGFNIYRKDFEPDFLIDLTMKHRLIKIIRLGLAQPIYGAGNAYIPITEYGDISQKIVDLARKCDAHDIALDFDCGFTLCMFSESQLGSLYFSGTPFMFTCPSVIDIGTNLDVWHCFPLSTIMNRKLSEFTTRDEIVQYYARRLFRYRSIGAMDGCRRCRHLKRGFCAGGCIAHNLAAFHHGSEFLLPSEVSEEA